MPFYGKGNVRIRYEDAGSGFPLLLTTPAPPYVVSIEVASLCPNADVTVFPWRESYAAAPADLQCRWGAHRRLQCLPQQ